MYIGYININIILCDITTLTNLMPMGCIYFNIILCDITMLTIQMPMATFTSPLSYVTLAY